MSEQKDNKTKPAEQKNNFTDRSRMILETSIDGFCMVGLDGMMVQVNSSLCDILGYSREELLKMTLSDVEAIESPEDTAQHIDKVMRQGYDRFETKHRRKDGRVIHVEVSTQYRELNGDKFLFSFFRDITDFWLSIEKLRESHSMYETLCSNIPGMVYRARPDWSTEFVANSETVCGYAPEDFCSDKVSWFDIVHPDDRESVLNDASRVKATCSKTIQQYRVFGKDGSIHWVEDHKSSTFTKEGLFSGVDGVVFDITERKRLEMEREMIRDDLLRAQRRAYISSVGSIVAHQINQPLTKMNILLDRVLEKAVAISCNPDNIRDIKESLIQIEEATSIIRKFRQHANSFRVDGIGQVNVHTVAKKIASMLSKRAQQANMRISIKDLGDSAAIEADETALEQMFLIIVQNAIEAADGRKPHKLDITWELADGNIELRFSDDCCGIAPENLDRIFEPFFSAKAEDEGMGLGLDTVKQILISCGGHIRVESQPGEGSTFYITLPISNALKP